MDTDRMVKAMARWWQNVSDEEGDVNSRNPMLYDPLHESKTTKTMQYVAAILICFGAISAGTALAWTSPVIPQLEKPDNVSEATNATNGEFYLTSDQTSWVGSLLAIGAMFGAIPAGYLADKIGRKYTAILMDIPFIVSLLILRYATSAAMLYAGRFLIGISTGSFCVVAPMYISEIAETNIRGQLGTFFQLSLTIGILITNFVGALVDWVALSTICLLFPAILLIAMFFLPETPTYLIKKGRRGDAGLSLKWLWGRECDTRSTLQFLQTELESSAGNVRVSDLFTIKANRVGMMISLSLMAFQQLSGINAVIFYTVPIFKSAGSTMDASVCGIIVSAVQVLMTFGSSLLIERAGRKVLLLISSAVMGFCLFVLGVYFHLKDNGHNVAFIGWIPLLSVILFIVTFSIGFGPIPWLMMGELFLPDYKGVASSLSVTFNWVGVFVVTKCFSKMVESWGSDITFWFFGVCMVAGTAFVATKVFETKGKNSTQIQILLSGTKGDFEAQSQLVE
ncbi:unnamed protein product [Hermetia illucens]|uniref:Major facilitator superfamily (MFS) profile domain-containing protein n=1 Tax=Hermetia illucens TaxID=343691 RepID=A0A7R8UQJ6_HERIL|nr:facilitated trehalose transporter Tret1-2 homolog isoform X2 [Hermetia illucens]CAD7085149.1 unnamed protein product [Hermetia illucens]